jgi:four helix bundle protein
LLAWQKARLLTKEIYELSRGAPLSNDYGLIRQMQRAAVSVMSNIAEGFDRTGSGEFHRFLSIAKGSCGELRSQLYVAFDAGYIDMATMQGLLEKTDEVCRIVGGLRAAVQRSRDEQRGK